jgi:glucose-6-phosphate dehydrogenase assembly protein OpcA
LIENATLRAIETELARLDGETAGPDASTLRTRVLTHMAWVPGPWEEAARAVLAGLGDRHPSRTILLLPDPESDRDALDAEAEVHRFGKGGVERSIASEVITIWLRGRRAGAPASVVQPLLVSDLPAFLRWRGALPFGAPELEQLVGVADRLIVDGTEWDDPGDTYRSLPTLFDRIAVSDIAWSRLLPWREAVAALWPEISEAERLVVAGPLAEALLLCGWLRSRLARAVELDHEERGEIELVEVGGRAASPFRLERRTPSELLSAELELYGRDPVYEDAVRSAPLETS